MFKYIPLIICVCVIGILIYLKFSPESPKFKFPDKSLFHCYGDNCVYYRVTNGLFPIKQQTKYSCWAASLTMLLSWKEHKKLKIEEVVKRFGNKFQSLYNNSESIGIAIEDEFQLYERAGLKIMQQLSLSIEGWEYYLRECGPLSVTIDANPPYGGTIHAILVTGIYGRRDASNTMLSYIDPLDGKEHLIDFKKFIQMYEAKYSVDWLIQVIYFPKTT